MKIYASVASSFIILRIDEMYPIYSSYALRFCLVVSVCVRLYSILFAFVTETVAAVVRELPPKIRQFCNFLIEKPIRKPKNRKKIPNLFTQFQLLILSCGAYFQNIRTATNVVFGFYMPMHQIRALEREKC